MLLLIYATEVTGYQSILSKNERWNKGKVKQKDSNICKFFVVKYLNLRGFSFTNIPNCAENICMKWNKFPYFSWVLFLSIKFNYI